MDILTAALGDSAIQTALQALLVGLIAQALRMANRWLDAWLTTEARARLADGMRRAAELVADSGQSPEVQAREVAEYARSMLSGSVAQLKASDLDLLRRAQAEVAERAARAAAGARR